MVNKHNVDHHRSPSRLTSMIYPVIFHMPLRNLSLSPLSLKPVYPTKVGKIIQVYGIQITKKCICESKKLNVDIFTHAPASSKKLFIPPGSIFLKNLCPPLVKMGEELITSIYLQC